MLYNKYMFLINFGMNKKNKYMLINFGMNKNKIKFFDEL